MTGSRTIATPAGELRVLPLSPEASNGIAELFPRVDVLQHEGREVLGLFMADGARRLHGLRTAYGYYAPEDAQEAHRMALFGRLCMPAALAAFRARGFEGAVLAGACVSGSGDEHRQAGELLFVHARSPLAGGVESEPLSTWEQLCGTHSTTVLLTLVADVMTAWKAQGMQRTLTDLEPCPADDARVRWAADLALVNGRFVLVRPVLEEDDPLLEAFVEAGISEVEWTPSAFVLGQG